MSDFWLVKKFPCPFRFIGKKFPNVSVFSWSLPVIISGSSSSVVYKSCFLVFDPTNFQNTFGLFLAYKDKFFSYFIVAFLVNLLSWFEQRLYSEYIFPSSVTRYLFHSLYFFRFFASVFLSSGTLQRRFLVLIILRGMHTFSASWYLVKIVSHCWFTFYVQLHKKVQSNLGPAFVASCHNQPYHTYTLFYHLMVRDGICTQSI